MPTLHAELQIAGRQVRCDQVSYSFLQTTDEKGRPSSVVRTGFLIVVISGEAAGWSLWEEIKFDDFRRVSGHVVFFQNEYTTTKRYTFYDAALIHLQFRHDGKGTNKRQAATEVELHFSAATIEVHGIRLENFSLIPWATSPATSFKALTKPADPLPSAHLAAGAALLAQTAKEAVPKIIDKVKPIPLAGLARTLTLLPSLLLRPMNADADLSKDYDNQLYNRNHPPFIPLPKPDNVRLAELERALENQTLDAQQEAELIILLAKVKGIFVNELADLTSGQKAAIRPPKLDPSKKPLYGPTISKWHRKGGMIEVLPNGNWKYTDWEGNYVVYEGDEPNFDYFARQQVDIDGMQGNYTTDFSKANANAPEGPILKDNTWHHKHNMKTMQEVPTKIHSRFTHYGGCSNVKNASKPINTATFRKRKPKL